MILNLKKEIAIFLALLIMSCVFIYLLLNGGAYFTILRYDLLMISPFTSEDLKNGQILNIKNSAEAQTIKNADGYYLFIPKINVLTPIILSEDNSNKSVLASLESGVGLYPDSQLPGETGRSVILGHSSKATWYRGKYAYVFALLGKLENNDEFYVVKGNSKLVYKIFSSGILTPEQTDKLLSETPKNESDMVLITCWPVGASSKRTVIQAKLDHTEKM